MDQLSRAVKENLNYRNKIEALNLHINALTRELEMYKKNYACASACACDLSSLQKKHLEVLIAQERKCKYDQNNDRFIMLSAYIKEFEDNTDIKTS